MGMKQLIEKNPVVWFLGALLAAFLAGIGAYEAIVRMSGQAVVSREDIREVEALRKKERFLSLFLRYEQAAGSTEKAEARDALDSYIQEFVDEADKVRSTVRVGKGSGRQTTITFPDGSRWTVPPDFRGATRR